MSFQSLTESDKVHSPVKKEGKYSPQYIFCGHFTGELSSTTGITSKFLNIPKIIPNMNPAIEPRIELPDIVILCSPECVEHCINIHKKK